MRKVLRGLTIAGATMASLWVADAIGTRDAEASTKCVAAKARCVSEKVHGLLRCYEKAALRGVDPSADTATMQCTQRAASRFDGGGDAGNGCFGRAEARANASKPRSVCLTTDDAAEVGAQADGFVAGVVEALDPGSVMGPRFEDTGLTVIDHLTGLEWEKKTTDGGLHDMNNLYQLSDAADDDLTDPDGDAYVFLAALNDCSSDDGRTVGGGFAGQCDWRFPQVDELLTIVDTTVPGCGTGTPCIDPVFGPTAADGHLSATSIAGNPTNRRSVSFEHGGVGFGKTSDRLVGRAVRGGQRR